VIAGVTVSPIVLVLGIGGAVLLVEALLAKAAASGCRGCTGCCATSSHDDITRRS
jgi:hypothetical protein